MIRILVDTSSDYTVEEIKAKGLELVPMHITFGEEDYRDVYDLTKDAFYELLTSNEEFPKTSQPTPQDFVDIFEDMIPNLLVQTESSIWLRPMKFTAALPL